MRLIATAAALAALIVPAAAVAASPYSTAPYTVTDHPYTFGQAPVFLPDGRVVVGKDFSGGTNGSTTQIYRSDFDGSNRTCLTCGMKGPNNVPSVRPKGDWILFHSWNGHTITIGSPGYGGLGSELWVMKPDGSQKTQLTGTDAAHGAGEGEDDYHAYWSPDGNYLVYAHLNWNFVTDGGDGKWDVRVARFVDDGVHPPHLGPPAIVRPANGHWYETQWWAPDGSGFLYTETSGTASNPELFYCALAADFKSCKTIRHLTDGNPGWDEQGIFTPDGSSVLFMSTRDHPGFFNTFSGLAQGAGLPTDADYLLILPLFELGFLTPVAPEATDIYQLDLATNALRRLTTEGDDGWIIPEFTWDPSGRFLFYTEQRVVDRERVTLPPDPATQLARLKAFLADPPIPSTDVTLTAAIKLEARTRILRFDLPASARIRHKRARSR